MKFSKAGVLRVSMCLCMSIVLTGCLSNTNSAQKGSLGGAGFGAIAGQIVGKSTQATLIGAGVGLGMGYIVGNEMDKKKVVYTNSSTKVDDYGHNEVGVLGGTRWQVTSINPKDALPPYTSKMIEFTPNGYVITSTTNLDGTIDIDNEHYRVVGQTLIMNGPDYIVNYRYSAQGDQLVIDSEGFNVVMKKL
ncbi:glycine zipper domain-containing protein [Desulfosediminicola flagellatus]|uniref:glycine zipper domain-containing protein n=1 Tax=Desulfosediminicola flagellatus TaxID=2569541 RepID=UPI001E42F917|nr:glycine zipper domain-containing protein [Desulfosediminicola flagellatus]